MIMSCYPTLKKQDAYPTLHDACYDDDAPSLARIDNEYGKNTSVFWLSVQLIQVASYTGICEKLRWNQVEDTARNIRQIGYHITLPEMMQFFSRFEQGYYQQFIGYERPNPQVIMKSFQRFITELMEERIRVSREKEAERAEEERRKAKANAVPPPPEIAERLEKFRKSFGN